MLTVKNWLPYEPLVLTGYAGYFLLGYRLKAYMLPEKTVRVLYLLAVISAVAMPMGNVLLSRLFQRNLTGMLEMPLGIGSYFIAVALFVFASRLQTEKWSEKAKTMLTFLGERMFGVYLVHVFFVYVLFRGCKWSLEGMLPILNIFAAGFLIGIASLVVSWCFSKATGLKKIV